MNFDITKKIESRKQLVAEMITRSQQLRFCEVGVHEGSFAEFMLHKHWDLHLTLVDPWIHQPNVTQDASNVSDEEHESSYSKCMDKIHRYRKIHKVDVIRDFSVNAAEKFEDNTFDFVYLDARHDYRSVFSDLTAWYPKVKPGGVFAGHDYFYHDSRRNLVEVSRAVKDFFYNNHDIYSTYENIPSWYIIK